MYNRVYRGDTVGLSVKFYIRKNTMYIRLIGEMDQENVGNLRDKLIEIIKEKNIINMVINMKELSFMDSTGIGIIIGILGFIGCGINYPIYKKMLEKGKSKYAYEIVELARQISEQ